jgi:hypothetical protein
MSEQDKNLYQFPTIVEVLHSLRDASLRTESLFLLHRKLEEVIQSAGIDEYLLGLAEENDLRKSYVWYLANPNFKPEFLSPNPQKVVAFDIESTKDPKGNPVFALAVAINEAGEVTQWKKGQESELVAYLCMHDLILTYNGLQFDFPVLCQAGGNQRAQELINKSLDISVLTEVLSPTQSKSLRLWSVAINTILKYLPKLPWAGAKDSGAHLIPEFLENGDEADWNLIWQHCLDDVAATRELYAFFNPGSLSLSYYYERLLRSVFDTAKAGQVQSLPPAFEDIYEDGTVISPKFDEVKVLPYKSFFDLLEEFNLDNTEPKTYGEERRQLPTIFKGDMPPAFEDKEE